MLFFALLGTASPLKIFYMSLHSTRQKTFKRRWLSAIWKLLRFFWVLMDMSLPRFDIYQGTGAANCLKNHTDSWCPYFFKKIFCLMSSLKFTMSDVTSLLLDNLSAHKIYIQTWGSHMSLQKMNRCRWCSPLKNF